MFLTPAILSQRDCDKAPFYLQCNIVPLWAHHGAGTGGIVVTTMSNIRNSWMQEVRDVRVPGPRRSL